jgi:polysaccharide pyruvyl transferase WcaK-like protein
VTVFDDDWGVRSDRFSIGERSYCFARCGARHSRRIHRPESFWSMRASRWLGTSWNPGARAIAESDAVWDISGGDSFTDLYGDRRFAAITSPKLITLQRGIPLVLLPQTYGPFRDERRREVARTIVRQADRAWARDERSFDVLRGLLGDDFDPQRHRCGVDVAFALEPRAPLSLPDEVAEQLEQPLPPIGLNVSGLLFNEPGRGTAYGFKCDYRELVSRLLKALLKRNDSDVLLIPHVITAPGHYESDIAACEMLAEVVPRQYRERVRVLPALSDPREVKWVIGRLSWFCGTRMHSTIAALSSGVPTAAIAYSIKTLGVFETCDQGLHVIDPRTHSCDEVVDRLWESFQARHEAQRSLAQVLPAVTRAAHDELIDALSYATAAAST